MLEKLTKPADPVTERGVSAPTGASAESAQFVGEFSCLYCGRRYMTDDECGDLSKRSEKKCCDDCPGEW